jgi:carboxymethylenebutenolidase
MPEIRIAASDGGGEFMAYVAMPKQAPAGAVAPEARGVVVMIQEIFGVNRTMRERSDWVAEMGFIAVCPDLFWRQQPGCSLIRMPDSPNGTRLLP